MTSITKRVRIRHPSGSSTIEVAASSSVGDVARLIESTVPALTSSRQIWKAGYPPRALSPCSANDAFPNEIDMIHISLAGTNDSPTIDFSSKISLEKPTSIINEHAINEPSLTDPDGFVVRRVIDADNSCLFNSIGYILLDRSQTDAPKLRQMVAQAVRDDPETFSEAFLGKEPQEYINFITNPNAWGGQIELVIFSRLFQTEIAACDIIRNRVDIYGTEENFQRRVFVIYDGIHYDALAFCFDLSMPPEADVTQFSPKDEAVLAKANAVCADQYRRKEFTDTSNFALRCVVCQIGLKGATEAQDHAKETGHANFAEFR
jgi:ubiquitin thioesterase OTU1